MNATLVGRDNQSISGANDTSAAEFGILFADNSDQIRLANVLIANFRHGCFEVDEGADPVSYTHLTLPTIYSV